MQEISKKAKKYFKELEYVLYFAGLKEPTKAAHEISSLLVEEKLDKKERKIKTGHVLKKYKIMSNEVRDEIYMLFLSYLANVRYKGPYVRYQEQVNICEKYKNVDKAIPNFVETMKRQVKDDFKNLLTNI